MQEFLKALPEWPDSKEKLQVYYSNFIINSETLSRHSHKLVFWEKIMIHATQAKLISESEFLIDSRDLEEKFQIDNLRPLGFNTLLREWKDNGLIIPEKEFYSTSMLQRLFKFLGFHDSKTVERERFIFMPCLDSSIGKYYSKLRNDAMELEDLQEILDITRQDVNILVEFWTRKGILKVAKFKDLQIFKKTEITVVDYGMLNVKKTLKKLKIQIQEMENSCKVLKLEIKEFMGQDKKIKALQTLKHLKVVESLLDKRHESKSNLETVLLKIDSLKLDKELVDAYDSGAKVLEQVFKDSGLSVDSVQETLDNLSDTLANVQQVQDAIHDFSKDSNDMEDIEKELNDLLLKDLEETQFPSMDGLVSLDTPLTKVADVKGQDPKSKERQAQLV